MTDNSLDRGEQEEYTLQLTITDNGIPQQTSTTQVIITINYENDNTPQFTENIYRITIPASDKDNEERQSLFRVFATDKDSGSNAEISYYIRDSNTGTKLTMSL